MQNHPVDYYQVCSNYVPEAMIGPAAGVTQANNKSTFLNRVMNVEYQIKEVQANYNMLANSLP